MPVTPDDEQLKVMYDKSPVLMIESVAGSGKTTTLALKAKHACTQGARPDQILGLCFSDGAKKRFKQKLIEEGASKSIQVMTVEEFSKDYIRRIANAGFLETPEIIDATEHVRHHFEEAIALVAAKYEARGGSDYSFNIESSERVEELFNLLRHLKATLVREQFFDDEFGWEDIDSIAGERSVDREVIEICVAYEKARNPFREQINWQCPGDYVSDLLSILKNYGDALRCIPEFRLYLVDEWHDVNRAELELIEKLRRRGSLVVVGDRFQTINSARGANIEHSEGGFDLAFPFAKRLELTRSRRYGGSLARMAHKITKRPCASFPELHTVIRHVAYDPTVYADCAVKTVDLIKKIDSSRQDIKLSDIAVVVREPDQTIEIENRLLDTDTAYICEGLDSYLIRPEILMLRGLLHIASKNFDGLKGDQDTCERMVEGLSLYMRVSYDMRHWKADDLIRGTTWMQQAKNAIGMQPEILEDFFDGVLSKAKEFDKDQILRWKTRFKQVVDEMKSQASTLTAYELLEFANRSLRLEDATRRCFINKETAESAARSILAFISFAKARPSMSCVQFLEEITTRQLKVRKKVNYLKGRPQVVLTTIGAAKGQEWKHVVVPYLQRGQFPRVGSMAEEARHLYVGVTRAIDSISILAPPKEFESAWTNLNHLTH